MAMTKMIKNNLSNVMATICQSNRSCFNARVTSFSCRACRICWLVDSNPRSARCMEPNCLVSIAFCLSDMSLLPAYRGMWLSPPFGTGGSTADEPLASWSSWWRGMATTPSLVMMVEDRWSASPSLLWVWMVLRRLGGGVVGTASVLRVVPKILLMLLKVNWRKKGRQFLIHRTGQVNSTSNLLWNHLHRKWPKPSGYLTAVSATSS